MTALARMQPVFAAIATISAGCGVLGELLVGRLQMRPLEELSGSPSVAICAILLSMAILRSSDPRGGQSRRAEIWAAASLFVSMTLMVVVLALGGIPLPQQRVDQPGTDTLLILIMLSASALLRLRTSQLCLWPLAGALGLMLHGVVGFTFGLPYFGDELAQMTMVTLLVLSAGTLTLFLHKPLIRVIFLANEIGRRTRHLMAVGTAVPWGCGMLLYHIYGVPERAIPVELLMFTVIIWSVALVAITSGHANERSDKRRREIEALLARQAQSDQLTGLLNRAGMQPRLEQAWQHVEQSKDLAVLILLDLDHFKRINDQYGHEAGDYVLAEVGRLIQPKLRETDSCARWGGEEILILLRSSEFLGVASVAERIRREVEALTRGLRLKVDDRNAKVTASLGVADIRREDGGYLEAIRRADAALYLAKGAGRNRVVFDARLRDQANSAAVTF